MVAEVSRICGSVGLHGGMTSYLGRACVGFKNVIMLTTSGALGLEQCLGNM